MSMLQAVKDAGGRVNAPAPMIELSAPQLGKMLNRVVSELELVIAKNIALGVSKEHIAEILSNGITVPQIEELQQTESFQALYSLIAQHMLTLASDTAIGWDELEAQSIRNLMREARVSRDPEFNLRLAAVANRAVRRHKLGEQILDPGAAGTRVQITLSQRFINKLSGVTEIEERRVDVKHITNPSLDQVTRVLNALGGPRAINQAFPSGQADSQQIPDAASIMQMMSQLVGK